MNRFQNVLRLSLLLLLLPPCLQAQNTIFLTHGKIEFEKKVNLYAQLGNDDSWSDAIRKSVPQFKTNYFDLLFSGNRTLYRPGRENPDNTKIWEQPAEENVVYCDLAGSRGVSQKKVYEELFLLQDSLRRIKWKITGETRMIAGFSCRRANALILDSVYVVAFYTDEIIPSGGPESFTGLPGMILGIALPHQHVTWFATKVQSVDIKDNELKEPVRGKKMDYSTLEKTLAERLKAWGKHGRLYIQTIML